MFSPVFEIDEECRLFGVERDEGIENGCKGVSEDGCWARFWSIACKEKPNLDCKFGFPRKLLLFIVNFKVDQN